HKKWGIFLFPEYQTDSLNQNISPIPSPILQRNLFLFKHTSNQKIKPEKTFQPRGNTPGPVFRQAFAPLEV
ncbi:MAG: hypothetical protein ACTHNW_06190, partial [Mucilaginibacter sp.]